MDLVSPFDYSAFNVVASMDAALLKGPAMLNVYPTVVSTNSSSIDNVAKINKVGEAVDVAKVAWFSTVCALTQLGSSKADDVQLFFYRILISVRSRCYIFNY